MYHQVGRPVRGVQACEECVSPEQFERQMQALVDAGYRVLTLTQLAARLSSRRAAALDRTVVLTFDDGLRGQFVNAFAVLRRYGLPATFFPVAGYVGQNVCLPHLGIDESRVDATTEPVAEWRTMAWQDAAQIARNGMEIGCHSLTHRSMGAVPPAEMDAELQLSKRMLEHRLRIRVGVFAYPFGSEAYGDCGRGVQERLRDAGYRAACTTLVGTNGIDADVFALRRIPVEEGDGPFRLRCKLIGAYDWVGIVKSRWQRVAVREDRVDVGSIAAANC